MVARQDGEADWDAWVGRTEESDDVIDPVRARALHAALDLPGPPPGPGDPLPPLWHWLYFWSIAPGGALGPDGHPQRGGFLPPIPLPRRMWAGSRITCERPLPVSALSRRRSAIEDIKLRDGRSGRLAFVTVRHDISVDGTVCISDRHDIVYRAPPRVGDTARPGESAPRNASWQQPWQADPVLLFRYSALTFNGHRIHYDRTYATGVEGYPGLVVHGPLLATVMVELARAKMPGAAISAFEFRALQPVFDGMPVTVAGASAADGSSTEVWIAKADGTLAAKGRVAFAAMSRS